jgi:hypothetical protein
MRRPRIRSLAGGAAGIAAGAVAGIGLSFISAAPSAPAPPAPAAVDAAHVPPLLTLAGERVRLRFAIVCTPREDGEPCRGSGNVYARAGQNGAFRQFALQRGDESVEGRYFVDLPEEIAMSPDGFSYYAVLRDDDDGAAITVPSGGAAAPHRSLPLGPGGTIALGAHAFGHVRRPDARVVDASWGSGLGELGLAGSRELGFVGPSAFDVSSAGAVTVLDEVNHRVLRWSHGRTVATPVDVSGGLADLAVEPDGSLDVLEPPNRTTPAPTLRRFRADGTARWTERVSDRTWAKLAAGPDGPVALQQPSEQWLPLAEGGTALPRAQQAERGRPGQPVATGREVLVDRVGAGELRLGELVGNALVRSWRVTSATPLGEVQLAEPFRNGLVVVVKTYTHERDEFVVLVLDGDRLAEQFSVDAAQWAESAPLARFRLAGGRIFHLGSTPAGAFVDRFDLEVPR